MFLGGFYWFNRVVTQDEPRASASGPSKLQFHFDFNRRRYGPLADARGSSCVTTRLNHYSKPPFTTDSNRKSTRHQAVIGAALPAVYQQPEHHHRDVAQYQSQKRGRDFAIGVGAAKAHNQNFA